MQINKMEATIFHSQTLICKYHTPLPQKRRESQSILICCYLQYVWRQFYLDTENCDTSLAEKLRSVSLRIQKNTMIFILTKCEQSLHVFTPMDDKEMAEAGEKQWKQINF